jgi:uncharacterized cupin superfamily protein
MVEEARLEQTEAGLTPAGDGWFVVNAADAVWFTSDAFGSACIFESRAAPFRQLGVNLRVLQPGQANGRYHGENTQEDFLVLHGECLLLVSEQERRLRAWDFVHCPAATEHIFVGAGDGPCVIVMMGSRAEHTIRYPVSELATRHGAGVETETGVPAEAYARFEQWQMGPAPEGALPPLRSTP